jgi:DNA recombination-mediator protein A
MSEIRSVRRRDAEFPRLLAAIHDPPPRLYVRGAAEVALLAEPAVAIVGARACSAYGRSVTRSLARELASAGLVVVSGMARGIDGEAHRGALEGGGRTVAVLGCGIDRDYPAAHAELARRIGENGLVVSEYEPGVEPAPWRFPARKRRGRLGKPIRLRQAVVCVVQVVRCAAGVVPVWSGERCLLRHRLRTCPFRPSSRPSLAEPREVVDLGACGVGAPHLRDLSPQSRNAAGSGVLDVSEGACCELGASSTSTQANRGARTAAWTRDDRQRYALRTK